MAGTIKAQVQLGDSATATQNFTITSEAADGTMKLARGNKGATSQDVMTISAAGIPTFNQLVQTLGASGSVVLAGGLTIKWGSATSGAATNVVTYPVSFATATVFAVAIHISAAVYVWPISNKQNVSFNNICYTSAGVPTAGISYDWLAIGY
jgi:hypothetical protein